MTPRGRGRGICIRPGRRPASTRTTSGTRHDGGGTEGSVSTTDWSSSTRAGRSLARVTPPLGITRARDTTRAGARESRVRHHPERQFPYPHHPLFQYSTTSNDRKPMTLIPPRYPRQMFDSNRIDPTALTDWRARPTAALKCYLFAGLLTFYPHEYNADTRKLVTVLVFTTWGVIEVLGALGVAAAPNLMVYLRPAVFLILGQMWGIEIVNMQAFGANQTATNTEDDS